VSFLPPHPRSLQSPQWLHISYVLAVFGFVLTTHSSSLKANIFGTEQDRVNCSFYYKVCGFYAENRLAENCLCFPLRSVLVGTGIVVRESISSPLSLRPFFYRMYITTPHMIPFASSQRRSSKKVLTPFTKICTVNLPSLDTFSNCMCVLVLSFSLYATDPALVRYVTM
jgi:hypothetical protein